MGRADGRPPMADVVAFKRICTFTWCQGSVGTWDFAHLNSSSYLTTCLKLYDGLEKNDMIKFTYENISGAASGNVAV